MVPIFTYRDERKLFAVVGAVIVAASIVLVQLEAARAGRPSLITVGVTSAAVVAQSAVAATSNALRNATSAVADAPRLYADNARLRAANGTLTAENERLREALAEAPEAQAIAQTAASESGGIAASVIGYDPENQSRTIVLDRGSRAGVALDAGVIASEGVVGRIVEVEPFASKALLITDPSSKVPAIVQRGRWWGIATGTNARLQLQYVSQDAKLRAGDAVVTGAGRAFAAGLLIGHIADVNHAEGTLYQTALVAPAVPFGRLSHVVVLAQRR